MIPNIFSLLGESIVGKHIAKGIIFSNSPKKFHPNGSRIQVYDMPIGSYYNFDVSPTCGLAGIDGIIDCFDNPVSFYSAERGSAQLIWFNHGFLEYRFPNKVNSLLTLQELSFTLELCSEAPGYSEDWPSDITISIYNSHADSLGIISVFFSEDIHPAQVLRIRLDADLK